MQRKRIFRGAILTAALLCCAPICAACAAAPTVQSDSVPTAAVTAVPMPTPAPTAEPTLTPSPTPSPTPVPTPFSILWMSDTQRSAGHRGDFAKIAAWSLEQIEPHNILAFLHTGDIVDVYSSAFQWEQAQTALVPLRETLPSLLIAGNHDMAAKMKNYNYFRDNVYPDGDPDNAYNRGQGRYMLLSAGGIDWLFLGMSYQYLDAELDWLSEVLAAHPERTAVLMLHEYLWEDGRLMVQGERVFERLVMQHDNLRLILCGHNDGYCTREDRIDTEHGTHTVQTLLCNMQHNEARRGTVQILTIDPVAETLSLYAYTPVFENMLPRETQLPIELVTPAP